MDGELLSSTFLPHIHSYIVHRKVVIALEELGLTYEPIYLDLTTKQEHKAPEYTKYNPNGRIPTLIDHKNNDLVIWSVVELSLRV